MSIRDFFKLCEDDVELYNNFEVHWSKTDVGFGSFQFYTDEDGKLYINNECMSRRFIKQILCDLVDSAELEDDVSSSIMSDTVKVFNSEVFVEAFERAKHGREPLQDEILKYAELHGVDFDEARVVLQEQQYGGKPPAIYENWDHFWKSY